MIDFYDDGQLRSRAERARERERLHTKYKNNPFRDEYGLRGWVKRFGIFLAVVAVVGGLIFGLVRSINQSEIAGCRQEAHTMGLAWRFQAMSDTCYLKVNGQYIPDSAYIINKGN